MAPTSSSSHSQSNQGDNCDSSTINVGGVSISSSSFNLQLGGVSYSTVNCPDEVNEPDDEVNEPDDDSE